MVKRSRTRSTKKHRKNSKAMRKGKSKKNRRSRKQRGGEKKSLLKKSLLDLVNDSTFTDFDKFLKENNVMISKEEIVSKINKTDGGKLNELLKKVLDEMYRRKQEGGSNTITEHEFSVESPFFNPSNLFNCIMWAIVLVLMDSILLLGIWLGMCTSEGGIRT